MSEPSGKEALAGLLILGVLVGLLCVGYGVVFFGDWTCGFTHCVKVKP